MYFYYAIRQNRLSADVIADCRPIKIKNKKIKLDKKSQLFLLTFLPTLNMKQTENYTIHLV